MIKYTPAFTLSFMLLALTPLAANAGVSFSATINTTTATTNVPEVTVTLPAPGTTKTLSDGSTVDAEGMIRNAAGTVTSQIHDDGRITDVTGNLLGNSQQLQVLNQVGATPTQTVGDKLNDAIDKAVDKAVTGAADNVKSSVTTAANTAVNSAVNGALGDAASSLGISADGSSKGPDAGLTDEEKPISADTQNKDLGEELKKAGGTVVATSTPGSSSGSGTGIVPCGKGDTASIIGVTCGQ